MQARAPYLAVRVAAAHSPQRGVLGVRGGEAVIKKRVSSAIASGIRYANRLAQGAPRQSIEQTAITPLHELMGLNAITEIELYAIAQRCQMLASPVYLGNDTALCRILGALKLYIDTRDTGFGSHVLLDGYWELGVTGFVVRQVREGMTAVDVGANFGYYTALLAALVGSTGRVFAIEPNPPVAANLRRSVDLNGFAARTTVIQAAAGAEDGREALLFVPEGEPKNAALVPAPDVVPPRPGTLHKIYQATVDQIVAEVDRIDFIKVDAEGAEEDIVAGTLGTLTRDRPRLVLEYNGARCRNALKFLGALREIYGRLRYIDQYGNPLDVTEQQLVTERFGEDWLLCLDDPARLDVAPTESGV